jgi:hypothetical protein
MTKGRGAGMGGEPDDTEGTSNYVSYLLRLWRENDDGKSRGTGKAPLWRASLENSQSGERKGFASLMELFHFIWKETAGECGNGSPSNRTGEGGDVSKKV